MDYKTFISKKITEESGLNSPEISAQSNSTKTPYSVAIDKKDKNGVEDSQSKKFNTQSITELFFYNSDKTISAVQTIKKLSSDLFGEGQKLTSLSQELVRLRIEHENKNFFEIKNKKIQSNLYPNAFQFTVSIGDASGNVSNSDVTDVKGEGTDFIIHKKIDQLFNDFFNSIGKEKPGGNIG